MIDEEASGLEMNVKYQFNHTKPHGLERGGGEEVAITSARQHPGTVCELRFATLCCSTLDQAAVSHYTEIKPHLRQIVFSGAHH